VHLQEGLLENILRRVARAHEAVQEPHQLIAIPLDEHTERGRLPIGVGLEEFLVRPIIDQPGGVLALRFGYLPVS